MSTSVPASESKEIDPAGGENVEFRCSFCDATYSHEWLTRVHITRADDEQHKNHDGLMPETPVKVVFEDGATKSVTRNPDEIDVGTLVPADLPESMSQERKRIVLIAAANPYIDTYTQLHERVQSVFSERDLGSVSYQTVNRVVREFFLPRDGDEDTTRPARERYTDLTEKQRQIVDAYLDDPDASYGELAEQAGTSRSYPAQILNRYESLLEELEEARDDETATGSNESVTDEHDDDTTEQDAEEAEITTDSEVSETRRKLAVDDAPAGDGPITSSTAKVLSATPYDEPSNPFAERPDSTVETTGDDIGDEPTSQADAGDDPQADDEDVTTDDTATAVDSTSSNSPSVDAASARDQIEDLKERVAFLRRITERQTSVSDPSSGDVGQLAVLEEVEAELERILTVSEE